MKSSHGVFESKKVTLSKALRSFVDKQVARWVTLRTGAEAAQARYFARFERMGLGHLVECRLEVWAGDRSWVGADYGIDPQEALQRCLDRMATILRQPQPTLRAV